VFRLAVMASKEEFSNFYKDLKATEKADAVLTSAQQIDRLLRPGATYRNLNPFEVSRHYERQWRQSDALLGADD